MLKKIFFEIKGNKKINIIITAAYFLLHLFVVLRHEHWCDEAQAWVLAKNLPLFELIRILPTEGHPCAWFVFIMPFAKLGLSFDHVSYISLIVMTITVYIFLEKSPFSLAVNIGILFSSIFLFYNPVVFRSYCLIALLIVLLAIFYEKKLEKPILYGIIVALIFQSHVVVFGLGIGLFIDLLIEYIKDRNNKQLLISVIIIGLSFIAAVLELMPRASLPMFVNVSAGSVLSNLTINNLLDKFGYFGYTAWGVPQGILSLIPYGLLIGTVLCIFVFITKNRSWSKNYQMIIISVCAVGEFFGVLVLVYTPHTQMASIMTMILLFLMWQFYKNNDELNLKVTTVAMMAIISFFTFIVCQSLLRLDIGKQFSQSKMMSDKIESVLKDGTLVIENAFNDSPVYCYLDSHRDDIEVFDLRTKKEYVYHLLGPVYEELSYDYIFNTVKESIDPDEDVYYLTYKEVDDDRYTFVYTTADINSIWMENYYLYKVNRQ